MGLNRAIQPTMGQGDPLESYKLKAMVKPKASRKNVVVRVVLRPVHPSDLIASRWGSWANLDLSKVVVGCEGVGVIDQVGEGVTAVKVGQRVIPLIWSRFYSEGYGLWRDYIEVPEIDIVPVPDDISDAVAAQFFLTPWTVYGLLNRVQIPKGNYLLQTAAGSVLGRQVITLAKYCGIKTINIVRRNELVQSLKDLGADYVINSSTEDVKEKVLEITGGKGAYAALDAVAMESSKLVASCVRDGGLALVYGILGGEEARIAIPDMMRGVKIDFFLVSDFSNDLPQRKATASAVLELMSKKIIDPLPGKTFPLEKFKEAINESERDAHGGKVLISSY